MPVISPVRLSVLTVGCIFDGVAPLDTRRLRIYPAGRILKFAKVSLSAELSRYLLQGLHLL
jgi:hypothetical protein